MANNNGRDAISSQIRQDVIRERVKSTTTRVSDNLKINEP